jgi:hypothetical protein
MIHEETQEHHEHEWKYDEVSQYMIDSNLKGEVMRFCPLCTEIEILYLEEKSNDNA